MNIWATKVKKFEKQEGQVLYRGINEATGKLITVVSAGHLNHNGHIDIFAATAGRYLMSVDCVCEVNDYKPSTVYICD